MNLYLKKAKLIKSISSRVNPDINPTPAQTPTVSNTNNNENSYLDIGTSNTFDYFEEARNLLSPFIRDQNVQTEILKQIDASDPNNLKILVLNWNKIKPVLAGFRGSVVNVKNLIDALDNALKEEIIKKVPQVSIVKQKNIDRNLQNIIEYFFDDSDTIRKDLKDSPETMKRVLSYILNMNPSQKDEVLINSIIKASPIDIELIVKYKNELMKEDKNKLIDEIDDITRELDAKPTTYINLSITAANKKIDLPFRSYIKATKSAVKFFDDLNKENIVFVHALKLSMDELFEFEEEDSNNSPLKVITGKGLKPNEQPIKDKYYVNKDLLKNHGILEIRYIKNRHLAHVKPPMLSNGCKSCALDMIDGKKINADDFVKLNQFEKDLLRRIDKLFQTGQSLNDDDEENFVKNFELLKGEYLAGNNNTNIKNQLRHYIDHAYDIGKINQYQMRRMLFELKLI